MISTNADFSGAKQPSDIEDLVSRGVRVLIVAPELASGLGAGFADAVKHNFKQGEEEAKFLIRATGPGQLGRGLPHDFNSYTQNIVYGVFIVLVVSLQKALLDRHRSLLERRAGRVAGMAPALPAPNP